MLRSSVAPKPQSRALPPEETISSDNETRLKQSEGRIALGSVLTKCSVNSSAGTTGSAGNAPAQSPTQDASKVPGLPGGKSGPSVRPPSARGHARSKTDGPASPPPVVRADGRLDPGCENGIRMKLKHSKRCYQRPVPQAKPAFDAGKKEEPKLPSLLFRSRLLSGSARSNSGRRRSRAPDAAPLSIRPLRRRPADSCCWVRQSSRLP